MWERARGIEGVQCGGWGERDFTPLGLGDRIRLHANTKPTLRHAGQPEAPRGHLDLVRQPEATSQSA